MVFVGSILGSFYWYCTDWMCCTGESHQFWHFKWDFSSLGWCTSKYTSI